MVQHLLHCLSNVTSSCAAVQADHNSQIVEVPSNIIFQRTGSWYLAFLVIGFGVVSIATAFIHNLAGVIVTRIFLGTFEGVSAAYKPNAL